MKEETAQGLLELGIEMEKRHRNWHLTDKKPRLEEWACSICDARSNDRDMIVHQDSCIFAVLNDARMEIK